MLKCDRADTSYQRCNRWCTEILLPDRLGAAASARWGQFVLMDGGQTHAAALWDCAYLQVPVVHCAAAVRGLRRVLASVEQPTQLTVEPSPGDHELHSW